MKTNILAIDPGPEESAWIVYNPNGSPLAYSFGKSPNLEVLKKIATWDHHFTEPAILAIEQVASFGMAVGAEVFETVFWSGRFAQAWQQGGGGMKCDIHNHVPQYGRVKRHEVKSHLCFNSRAKDGNIRQALIDRFGKPGTKKSPGATYGMSGDVWQALAVAVTFADKMKIKPIAEVENA